MSIQSSNNNKRIAKNTLLPHALYDGGVFVHEPSHIECVGSISRKIIHLLYSIKYESIKDIKF